MEDGRASIPVTVARAIPTKRALGELDRLPPMKAGGRPEGYTCVATRRTFSYVLRLAAHIPGSVKKKPPPIGGRRRRGIVGGLVLGLRLRLQGLEAYTTGRTSSASLAGLARSVILIRLVTRVGCGRFASSGSRSNHADVLRYARGKLPSGYLAWREELGRHENAAVHSFVNCAQVHRKSPKILRKPQQITRGSGNSNFLILAAPFAAPSSCTCSSVYQNRESGV